MTFPPDIIEKVARAICHAGFCIRGKFERRPCVDDDGRTVECQATHNQLIPSLPWRCAQAALEELPPSAAVKEEREACAKVADEFAAIYCAPAGSGYAYGYATGKKEAGMTIAKDIRARSALATGKGK